MSRETALVTADWVAENINNPHVAIVEVDEDTTLYAQGHIENAITFNWREDLQDGLRRDIISKEGFEALLSKSGIANDTTVVLYGGNNNWFAAYAYWYFKLYGHQDVRLLDGGRKRWELDARPFVTATPTRTATRYVAKDQDLSLRAFRDEVVAAIGVKNIVDVRSPAEFSGELAAPAHLPQEGGQVKGHVPSAKNIPWSKAANEDGTFKSQDELTDIYTSAGVDLAKDTIAYCRIGERSAFSWFVLHELLGVKNVKNYDGSWTEYGSLVGVPVEIGALA
jgi:thiosulfate/3-mercaptopyruvate sulfurtransferase